MSCHRNTFVSGSVLCVAVIYGSTYVCDMKGHSSHSSSDCGSRRISMRHLGNTSWWTSLHGMVRHFQHIRLTFQGSPVLASECANTVLSDVPRCQQKFGKTTAKTLKPRYSLCLGWLSSRKSRHRSDRIHVC